MYDLQRKHNASSLSLMKTCPQELHRFTEALRRINAAGKTPFPTKLETFITVTKIYSQKYHVVKTNFGSCDVLLV